MKPKTTKQVFGAILDKAIFSPVTTRKQAKRGGYSGKRTRLRNPANASGKRRDKSQK